MCVQESGFTMTCLIDHFESICSLIENQIKPNLKGLAGIIVSGYLPQHWVFVTEEETVTLTIDKKGNANVVDGAMEKPDVTIEIDHKYLSTTLKAQSSPSFPPERSNVALHTSKGKTAYNYLKPHFGL